MSVKFDWEIRLVCTSKSYSTSIWQLILAILNIYSSGFILFLSFFCFASQQVPVSVYVGVSCKRAVHVSTFLFKHQQGLLVDVPTCV